jgi:CDP-glucose 4,6-dehydratase
MFQACRVGDLVQDNRGDIRDLPAVDRVFSSAKPEIVFHLAAQPIVSRSYLHPIETISTNVMGTANVLECIRRSSTASIGIIVTSDKAYLNKEWSWGYRETDELGGRDPYSASKAAAELITKGYISSFMPDKDGDRRIVTVRAGNVIGGGDWAPNRIIPDCVRAWSRNEKVVIRSPNSTRPWQHVLEPLSGYLKAATALSERPDIHGESFNFGPSSAGVYSVREIVSLLSESWGLKPDLIRIDESSGVFSEARLLKLACEKAETVLRWTPRLSTAEAVRMSGEWYSRYYNRATAQAMLELTNSQIDEYESHADTR